MPPSTTRRPTISGRTRTFKVGTREEIVAALRDLQVQLACRKPAPSPVRVKDLNEDVDELLVHLHRLLQEAT